ncbi:hypothetical protein SLS57_006426 [Botryosphaeria dothidea]
MARFLRPPIIQGGAHHLAGYSLALVRRLRPIHILAWAILAAFLFAVTECLRDGRFKTKLPVFDALDLVDFKDGRPTVPLDLHPQQAVRIAKANRFDDRYEFQHLIGHGCEGDVAIYRDLHTDSPVAVKSYYNNGRHPMGETWSQLFSHQLNTWPTEIPATLLLAGLHPHHSTTNLTHQGPHTFQHGLIPASDFFIALSPNPTSPLLPSWTTPSWHLVTPYLPHGTLASLAITLAQQSGNHTLAALDASFRPSFARLLSALATLHAKGFCHDDVKADNIYIAPTHHSWLLGDLGQVRAVGHAYHRTRHWARRNQWADCRANDLAREDEASAGEEVQVRREDQDKINRFSRLHQREKLLEEELKTKQKDKEDLEEVSTELELVDEEDKVPYKIGDSFVSLPQPEVLELLSDSTEKIDKDVAALEEQLGGVRDEMEELKVALYARFGRSINLET